MNVDLIARSRGASSTRSRLRNPLLRALSPALLVAFAAACGGGDDTENPAVESFTASPVSVMAGGRVNLSWSVKNADNVRIVAMPGAEVVNSSMLSGSQMSAAIDANTTFLLTASKGDRTATRAVMVTVMTDPGAPVIDSFTAAPTMVDAGNPTTLTWATTNAETVDIVADGRAVVTAGAADGSMADTPTAMMTTYVLTARAADGATTTAMVVVTVRGGVTAPMITSFVAMPNTITRGEMSTLRWTVSGTDLTITIATGGADIFTGTNGMASTTVMPDVTTTYTLTARNAGGMVTQMVTLTVNPPMGAAVVSFDANPTAVTWGVSADLTWEVTNATGITITGNGAPVTTSANLTGTFTVTPTVTTDYTLVAANVNGDAMSMTRVTFNPTAPAIRDFTASANIVVRGDDVVLSWETIGADRVRILTNGVVTATVTQSPNSNMITVPANAAVNRYTLEATNATGTNMMSVVVYAHAVPEIVGFAATPTTFSGTATITITWDVTSVADLQLYADNVAVPGFPVVASSTAAIDSMGSFDLVLSATTLLRLSALSLAGRDDVELTVYALIVEVEPNDSTATAMPVPGLDVNIAGTIGVGGDNDYYAIAVPAGGNVFAETNDGMGGCPFDTTIALLAPDGTTQIAFNDDIAGAANRCSRIAPQAIPAATNLAAGTYYLRVRAFSGTVTGPYILTVRVGAAECGNGIIESLASEQCDDGNATAGDGCSDTCTAEPVATITGPGTPDLVNTYSGSIDPALQRDFIQVTMSSAGYISVDTFAPTAPDCTGTDLVVTLLSSTFTVLGSDNDDGVGLCARINPAFDAFASVAAGTYWVRVEENGNNATVPAYEVQIRTFPMGCGNGILEGGETCDDGNSTNGDGCSATCTFEGVVENEAGGNNTYNGAGVLVVNPTGVAGTFLLGGDINPAGDLDWYAVDVPANHHVDAYLTVGSLSSCPVTPEGRVQFYGTNGTTLLASNDNSGPDTNCGRVFPRNDLDTFNRPVGRYFIRVSEDSSPAVPMPNYYLHVELIAPGCGNTYIDAGESCDDGNLVAGDGCSATCTFEPIATITLPAATTTTVAGSIVPEYLRPAVRLNVTATTYLYAETFSPNVAAGCNVDTVLRLYQNDGLTEVGNDDQDGINSCSLIGPNDPFARLAPGMYWLVTEEYQLNATIPAFELVVRSIPVDVCGNGVRESALGEICDDGNLISGDGCSATCQLEPVASFNGPPLAPTVVSDAITPIGNQDFYQLNLSAPTIIIAETGAPTAGACAGGADTILRLYSSTFTELTSNDDFGGALGACSRISGVTTAAARVPAGTYFLRVEDYLNNSVIAAYQLTVELRAQNVCGNGLVEGAEVCDDGNQVNGDGCSATCQLEVAVINEVEPNGTVATANASGLTAVGNVQIRGFITPSGDRDYFAFTVPAGPNLNLTANTYLTPGNVNSSCGTTIDTLIHLRDAADVSLVSNDDIAGAANRCSIVTRNLAPGTYYVEVREWNLGTFTPPYYLNIQLAP